ncbi:MAG: hypothetical protein ACI92C_000082 [Neolewinella sp.]
MIAGEAKNVDNAVVLARLFNEASGQKAPSKKHGLFISRPLGGNINPRVNNFSNQAMKHDQGKHHQEEHQTK